MNRTVDSHQNTWCLARGSLEVPPPAHVAALVPGHGVHACVYLAVCTLASIEWGGGAPMRNGREVFPRPCCRRLSGPISPGV